MGDADPTWSRRTWVLVLSALLVVLLTPSGVDAVRSARARAHDRAVRAIRVTLAGVGVVPQHGVAGSPVQDARLRLRVRNESPFGIRVLAAGIDEPPLPQDVVVGRGRVADVAVRWRVRCAEIGVPPGPGQLVLRVRGRGAGKDVRLELPSYDGVEAAVHLAGVDACAVLVMR